MVHLYMLSANLSNNSHICYYDMKKTDMRYLMIHQLPRYVQNHHKFYAQLLTAK